MLVATKKFRLLLLDANVVIYLFEVGLWDKLVDRCEVLLSRTVAEREAQFYEDDDGEKHYFDLQPDISSRRVTVVEASISDIKAFRDLFDPLYLSRLDDGEAESLAYLMNSREKCLICSGDAIVFRVLALLDRIEQGFSLEEILQSIGLARALPWEFTKAYRERWTNVGSRHRIQEQGRKPPGSL
jgi:hypothetical protein